MKSQWKQLSLMAVLWCLLYGTSSAAPSNDSFATPTVITGFPVTAYGTNVDATLEPSEPEPAPASYEWLAGKSIWFEWTAPTSGLVQIDTFGSRHQVDPDLPDFVPFSAIPAVWVGDAVDSLVEMKSGGTAQSRYINVTSGTTYRIAVYGSGNDLYDDGEITLHITNDASSHISGTVTGPDGFSPLQGILAQASLWNGSWWENASWDFTDASGHYVIRGLTGGTYRAEFSDWENRNGIPQYITEYYNNAPDLDSATNIVVPPGTTTNGIDASLATASEVSGTIYSSNGITPLEGIDVSIYRWTGSSWNWTSSDDTDANGDYAIEGLAAGTYRLKFTDWANGNYVPEVFDNATDLASGTDVVVLASSIVSGIDASLAIASKISGTVTGPDGITPLEYISAVLYRWSGTAWDQLDEQHTDTNGIYSIGSLASGTYRLEFRDFPYDNDDYRSEVYDGASDLDSGSDIILPAATILSGINAALAIAQAEIVGVRATNNFIDILFTGVEGRDYILQEGSMWSNDWSDVGTDIPCVADTNAFIQIETSDQGFWRIRRYP